MPASELLLSLFITVQGSSSIGNSTMKTWLEGLHLWHTINDAPWHSTHLLYCTLKGATKFTPSSSHQAKRDMVTIDHIKALHCHLDLTDAFNIAFFTLACIAFWSCC